MIYKSILGSQWVRRRIVNLILGLAGFAAIAAAGVAQNAPPAIQPAGAVASPALPAEAQAKLDKLEADLKTARAAGNSDAEAKDLNALGDFYAELGDLQQAMDYYNQALPILRAVGDRDGEANTMAKIGSVYSFVGEKQKALDYYSQALPILREVGDRSSEAGTLGNIGAAYSYLGENQKALDSFNQGLPIMRAVGDRGGEAIMLNNIGLVYSDLGEKQKALDYYSQALPIQREVGDRSSEAETLDSIGATYAYLGENQKALDAFDQGLPITRAVGDRGGEARMLNNIGLVYSDLGEKQKALDYYNQALPIQREVGDRSSEARTLGNIGAAYSYLGENQKALSSFNQALPISRAIGDPRGEAATLSNIGVIYSELGEKQKALDYYTQALPILRATGDHGAEAITLSDIGVIYSKLGDNQKALDYYSQALPILRAVGDRDGEATILNNIGLTYSKVGEKQKALDYCNQALRIFREVGNRAGEANMLNNIGLVYSDLGEKQKALDYYNQALPLAEAVSDPLLMASVFYHLMLLHKSEHPAGAIFYGKQAVNLLQQVRSNLHGLESDLQKSFLESRDSNYHDLADLLIAQGRLPEAQQVLDMMKLAEFEQFTRSPKPDSSKTASMTSREKAAEDAYQRASEHLFQVADAQSTLKLALEKQPNPTAEDRKKLADLDEQLATATRAFNNLLAALPSMLPNEGQKADAENMTRKIPGLANLLGVIAEPGTVALYTLVTDHYYRVIVISGDGWTDEKHTEIPIGVLRQQVARFKELLSKKPGQESGERTPAETAEMMELAAKLYAALIAPVAPDLDALHAHTLVWELDDALHYLPLGALYNTAAKQFVAEKYANVIITPTDQLNLQARPDLTGARVLALGLSRPDFDQNFGKLPNVPGELAAIVRDPSKPGTDGVLPGSEWLDLEFTEARFIGELKGAQGGAGKGQPYKIVHIASHFNADPAGDYIKSFLLLAGQNAPLDQNGYGFHLTLDDLSTQPEMHRIFKGVDLLTLSACQTAVTVQNGNGHEIDGLGGVAQQQGAGAVMASLWSVDDQSTSKLMARFYKLWTDPTATLTKVEALRQAQLEMLGKSTEAFADPYYWAPFILMGNWK